MKQLRSLFIITVLLLPLMTQAGRTGTIDGNMAERQSGMGHPETNISHADSTVAVTFIVNTAAVPDTLWPDEAVVQLRGDTPPLTWDGSTGVTFTNIGGDCWTATVEFPLNTDVRFKFFTNAVSAGGDNEHKGLEFDIDPGGNREFNTGSADTTLPVQFVNGSPDRQEHDWRPWVPKQNSIAVWVRVNMQGWEAFNPATDRVGIRGPAGSADIGNLSGRRTLLLTREQPHGNTDSRQYKAANFYSGVVLLPKDSVDAGQEIEYKFVITDTDDPGADPKTWESRDNRKMTVLPDKADTTMFWTWFDDLQPAPFVGTDTVTVNYRVDMGKAIADGGFHLGNPLLVLTGWSGSARDLDENSPARTTLTKDGFTNIYFGSATLVVNKGDRVFYQYCMQNDGQEVREAYFNFDFEDSSDPLAERRFFVPERDEITVEDIENSHAHANRVPQFQNTSVLSREVTVHWECDIRPAIYQVLAGSVLKDAQGVDDVTDADAILSDGVWMNGPATGGWTTWGAQLRGNSSKMMHDDGSNGDAVAGDSVFTVTLHYGPDETGPGQFIGQEYKFGIYGGDNEGGFGNHHIANIDDSRDEVRIRAQWGSIDPYFYSSWDYDKRIPVSVERLTIMPDVFILDQNYPNPFNPSTTIEFSITRSEHVTLRIYNTLGVQVATLIDAHTTPGVYRTGFDATGMESGVYFYRLTAGSFAQTRKMSLVK